MSDYDSLPSLHIPNSPFADKQKPFFKDMSVISSLLDEQILDLDAYYHKKTLSYMVSSSCPHEPRLITSIVT